MNAINIIIRELVATAEDSPAIVSDNTGYQIHFDFDDAWNDYEIKTAVFVYYRDSLPYSQTAAFSGNTVAVPQLPAVGRVLVGVTAGDLQTTTPAELKCLGSILSQGGELPEAPSQSEYARLMELIRGTYGASAYEIAVNNGYKGTEIQWLASLRGEQGAPGIQGPKGERGLTGATPVKGVDYFTVEEKEEMIQAVLAALPAAEDASF